MTDLQLTGALDGLKIADESDLPRYKRALADGEQMGFAYYFPNVLTRNRPARSAALLLEDEDSVCVFRWSVGDAKQRLDILVGPTPMNTDVLRRCLERANDYNGDRSARVLRVDAKDADILASIPSLGIKKRK